MVNLDNESQDRRDVTYDTKTKVMVDANACQEGDQNPDDL